MTTEREKFDNEPLEKVADVMATSWEDPRMDQAAKAEFLLRQTKAQIDAAESTKITADHAKKSVRWMAISASILAISVIVTCVFQILQYGREEQLFEAKRIAQIQVKPKAIIEVPTSNDKSRPNYNMSFCHIVFDVINYSGFKAKNIYIDLRFEKVRPYIHLWMVADENRKIVEGDQKGSIGYTLPPYEGASIKLLNAGESKKDLSVGGNVDVSESCKKEMFVYIRTIWDSENNHRSDRVHEYKIECTQSGKGTSYDLIHQKLISQEE